MISILYRLSLYKIIIYKKFGNLPACIYIYKLVPSTNSPYQKKGTKGNKEKMKYNLSKKISMCIMI
jgi:hypothetical protein